MTAPEPLTDGHFREPYDMRLHDEDPEQCYCQGRRLREVEAAPVTPLTDDELAEMERDADEQCLWPDQIHRLIAEVKRLQIDNASLEYLAREVSEARDRIAAERDALGAEAEQLRKDALFFAEDHMRQLGKVVNERKNLSKKVERLEAEVERLRLERRIPSVIERPGSFEGYYDED